MCELLCVQFVYICVLVSLEYIGIGETGAINMIENRPHSRALLPPLASTRSQPPR
jgi:hypothetical protein